PLSSWLARLLDPDQQGPRAPWTVLIAGGDIRVPKGASVEVDGSLVLVAGGRLRIEGQPVLSNGVLWRTPEGGAGNAASHEGGNATERQASDPSDLGPEPVRVLVVLEIPAGRGEPWNPPRFERLRLEGVAGPLPGTKP